MVCDGVGRRDYAFELHGVQPDWGGASEFVSILELVNIQGNGGKNSLSSMYISLMILLLKKIKMPAGMFLQRQMVI